METEQALAAIGRGHLVYRPKSSDYVTSVGMVKVDMEIVKLLHNDGLLEARPGYSGSLQLSETGKEVVDGATTRVS